MNLRSYFTKKIGMRIVDLARKTKMCENLDELYDTEYLDINDLKLIQFKRLRKLLIHCKENVPFYRHLFSQYGFDPEGMVSFTDIQCLPILTKDEIRKHFSQLKADNFWKFKPKIRQTGGSTGEPLKFYATERSHGAQWANLYRGFGFGGYRLGEKYATIAYGSLVPKKVSFRMPIYFWLQNTFYFPSYYIEQESFEEIIQLFEIHKPKYIYGYSSVIYQFARFLSKVKGAVNGLKAIFTTADMLYPEQRKTIEKELGALVFDNYGCPEAGVMTNECSQHDGYHYNMETCYIEIADQDASGAGRIVATNLTNYAFPMIRYDTGDIGRIGKDNSCQCGRYHTKIQSLLGRQRDVIILPDGRMLFGPFFNHLPAFYNNDRINRYQIIQTDSDKLEIHLEMLKGSRLSDFNYVTKLLENIFNNQVSISLVEGEFRESSISRKHRIVISDVDNIWTLNE